MIRHQPNIKTFIAITAVALITTLAGCGTSPTTRFYTLKPSIAERPTKYSGPPLRIGQVQIPSTLDRSQLVYESGSSELRIDDFSHWGAPLAQLIRSALTEDIVAKSEPGKVVAVGVTNPEGSIALSVQILAVRQTPDGATMDAAWTSTSVIGDADGKLKTSSQSHMEHLVTDTSMNSADAYAQGLSALTGQLAGRILAQVGDP
jgi:uncharacterized lipoprotein YmbA